VTSRVTLASSREHITGFARDQRGPWQWLASTTTTTTRTMTTTTIPAMEPTGRREPAGAGVATQTPSARAVRSMHPEVARSRSRPAGGDNLDLIYHGPMANKVHPLLNDRRSPMPRPERQRSGWIKEKGERERERSSGRERGMKLEDPAKTSHSLDLPRGRVNGPQLPHPRQFSRSLCFLPCSLFLSLSSSLKGCWFLIISNWLLSVPFMTPN